MLKIHLSALALAGVCLTSTSSAGIFADAVESYTPGVGYATEYSAPHLGYTNAAAALGQPNRDTAFGAVTPFNPPFSRDEIVSLGTNGALTVSFLTPIQNNPANPFGLDFIIYGSAGFIDVDYPNGQTDGLSSMFGHNPGQTRVWVSADGGLFYQLNPLFAPTVDGLYPTDGSGTFGVPVNPALGLGDFANKNLAEIRALYGGGAGGTGYDLSWAIDGSGQPVSLGSISQIRVEVLTGRAEIDAFVAVVPEPGTWALLGLGAVLLWGIRREFWRDTK